MFSRLKDFGRVTTRYDRNAATFLAVVCIAAFLLVMSSDPDQMVQVQSIG